MNYRKIDCPPAKEGVTYQATNSYTGEVIILADLAGILKRIASNFYVEKNSRWRIVCHASDATVADPD